MENSREVESRNQNIARYHNFTIPSLQFVWSVTAAWGIRGCGWGSCPWRSWRRPRCCACRWRWWSGGRAWSWARGARWRTCWAGTSARRAGCADLPRTAGRTSGCPSPCWPPSAPAGPTCSGTRWWRYLWSSRCSRSCRRYLAPLLGGSFSWNYRNYCIRIGNLTTSCSAAVAPKGLKIKSIKILISFLILSSLIVSIYW